MNRENHHSVPAAALRDAMPVIAGYFPIAVAYGLTARNAGLSFFESLSVSIFVFAGASQFIAAGMIAAGSAAASIVLAVFLVNLRHIAMSLSLRHRFDKVPTILYPVIGFAITDETFSIASTKKKVTSSYMILMSYPCYLSWVCGSGVGYLLGEILPQRISQSAEVTLYAMFISLLVPQAKKYPPAAVVALLAALCYLLLTYLKVIPGISILVSVVAVAVVAALIIKDESVHES